MNVRDEVIKFLTDEYNVDTAEAISLVNSYTKDHPEDELDPDTDIEVLAEVIYAYDESWE